MIGELSNHLWQSTVFAIVAGILTVAFRKNRAHVRYWLWLTASLKFLIPFALLMTLGTSMWSILPARKIPTEIAPPAVSLTVVEITQPFPSVVAFASTAQHKTNWLPVIALCVWAFGFAAIVLMRFRGWLRIRAAVRASSPIDLPAAVSVRSSLGLLEPGMVGFLRPVLLLPEGILKTLTPPQLKAVLAHELSHVRRRDNLTAAMHMIVEAVFWFHPLVCWISARLVEEREVACDEEVLRLGNEPRVYAEGILNVCKFYVESPLSCVSGVTGSDLKKRVGRIMRSHMGETLNGWRRLLLATVGVAALAVPLIAGVLSAPRRQDATAGNLPKFDVASIKPSDGKDPAGRFQFQPGGRFLMSNIPLRPLIMLAYGLPVSSFRGGLILGAPDWVDSKLFNIEAKAEGDPPREQMILMLQSLLADRFKMESHWETRQMPVYALVVTKPGKLGPQMVPHAADNSTCSEGAPPGPPAVHSLPPCGGGFHTSNSHVDAEVTMETLAKFLSYYQQIDRPVIDRTGLSGTFDLNIDYMPFVRNGQQSTDTVSADSSITSTIFEAVEEQLGLKLESTTGPAKVLVIDHVEPPSDNSAAAPGETPKTEAAVVKPNASGTSSTLAGTVQPGGRSQGNLQSAASPPAAPEVVQAPTTASERPKFDATSVKVNKSGDTRGNQNWGQPGSHVTITNYPLRLIITAAYQLTPAQARLISGAPDWIDSERFDVEAVAQSNPSREQKLLMLQSLLADRFKLTVHNETKQVPIYALVLAKPGETGPQLHPHLDDSKCADPSAPPVPRPEAGPPLVPCGGLTATLIAGSPRIRGQGTTMESLVKVLGAFVDRIVIDRTGLSGPLDVDLGFSTQQDPLGPARGPDTSAPDPSAPPTIFTALQDQLGLKLDPQTGPVPVLVIDHVEEPTPN